MDVHSIIIGYCIIMSPPLSLSLSYITLSVHLSVTLVDQESGPGSH